MVSPLFIHPVHAVYALVARSITTKASLQLAAKVAVRAVPSAQLAVVSLVPKVILAVATRQPTVETTLEAVADRPVTFALQEFSRQVDVPLNNIFDRLIEVGIPSAFAELKVIFGSPFTI